MASESTEISYPGAVPDALVHAFTARETSVIEGPPAKRRKLVSAPQSLRDVNGLSEHGEPIGYIPLAEFSLSLNFARANTAFDEYIPPDTPTEIPILLHTAKASIPSEPAAQNGKFHRSFKLKLVTSRHEDVFEDDYVSQDLIAFGKNLELAASLVCADRYERRVPAVCYQATMQRLQDGKSFHLNVVILWKDSLDTVDYKALSDGPLEVFSKYILQESEHYNSAQKRRTNGKRAGWHPREFYENVHIPEDNASSSAPIKCDMVKCQLFPFQRRAVRWLLQREGMQLEHDGQVAPTKNETNDRLPTSFRTFTDANGRVCFASHLFMVVTSDLSNWYDAGQHLKGGVLAEEMGLGKTVELISLICLNRRLLSPEDTFTNGPDGLRPSGATLIITPPAILEQWEQELKLHAPGLNVLNYTGITRHQTLSEQELVELLADYDVVLTTYNVLAREVHHTGTVKRNLRHEKKYETRKTPLVNISWWRVCLDEAQMIESGVSNAAKVARVIPRQNAWAVTGTPLRKDITDLLGLLLFLHYEPFCGPIWNRLCNDFTSDLASLVQNTTLRHSKDHVRSEIQLPSQKRIVITIPFNAVEEQRYAQLFEQMCEDCGLDLSGAPLRGDWNPDDPSVVEKMRSWLARLRQICLNPTGNYKRVFGSAAGPLRSVAEVLEMMIDQNDTLIHAEERALLLSQLRRGQLLENAMHRQQALDLWKTSLERATEIVKECRDRLQVERENKIIATAPGHNTGAVDTSDNEEDEADTNTKLIAVRQKLRSALELQHICVFFTGNAYYQIKTDTNLTAPDSEEFISLEKREVEAYDTAKSIRKELLTDISRKVGRYMKTIREKVQQKQFVKILEMKPQIYSRGLESRRVVDKLEAFCESLNEHAKQYDKWRQIMIRLLSQSLIDQEDETELEGDEYERSTKHQDEMYVYMEALRAMFADRHDALTGQKNVLIAHEVKSGIVQAQKGEGPSPKLFLEVMNVRSIMKPDPHLGSLRGIITELRSLATSLEWQANEGSTRARAELENATLILQNAGHISSEQGKIASNLEREVEMFRDTMNNRLDYYRQLQQISDTVAPYDEESVGKPLDERLFESKLAQERATDAKISTLRAKRRYLIHLRDESGSDDSSKICVICQSGFEIGVLTVCGHKYCKDCLRMWWYQHRTCPTCKKRLKGNDFFQITYKPQELLVQEEKSPTKIEHEHTLNNAIYADISSGTMSEIKNIDLDGSFGTKIDTLARHILWLREHDPGAKSVVFSQNRGFLDVLGFAFSRLKIGHSSVDNKDGIQTFKNDPAVECFLLHAKAQSSGLNLVNATHVFLCEPLINTAIELQAIARVHRIGQHRPTTVWMYLVSDTVEESIYELSVSRRMAHIAQKEKEREKSAESLITNGDGFAVKQLTESAIDSANSLEMEDAALSRLMTGGASGSELVKKDDLWQCLFGNVVNQKGITGHQMAAESEVARFLRGEAAEQRRTNATYE